MFVDTHCDDGFVVNVCKRKNIRVAVCAYPTFFQKIGRFHIVCGFILVVNNRYTSTHLVISFFTHTAGYFVFVVCAIFAFVTIFRDTRRADPFFSRLSTVKFKFGRGKVSTF